MPSAIVEDAWVSGLPLPEEPGLPPFRIAGRTPSSGDAELEAYDFIARCVLEKDSEFFDG